MLFKYFNNNDNHDWQDNDGDTRLVDCIACDDENNRNDDIDCDMTME